jgi:hypothetical protein
MTHISHIPDNIAGVTLMLFGSLVLLNFVGAIQAGLIICIGAVAAFWYGFTLVQGPQKLKRIMESLHSSSHRKH